MNAEYRPVESEPSLLMSGNPADAVFSEISLSGKWEPHVVGTLMSLAKPAWTLLDIGANIGAISLPLARVVDRVIAFEPSPVAAEYLRKNIRQNALDDRIEVVQAALGRSEGGAELHTHADQLGTAHLTETALGRDGDVSHVPVYTLDGWLSRRRIHAVDAIKMDVEGAEQSVLAGAEKTIRTFRPLLVVEYNPSPQNWFFGLVRDALYRTLRDLYPCISVIAKDGRLVPIGRWEELDAMLPEATWVEILCSDQT